MTVTSDYNHGTVLTTLKPQNIQTLEKNLTGRITREVSNVVDTVEDRIEIAVLAAVSKIIRSRLVLEVKSLKSSSHHLDVMVPVLRLILNVRINLGSVHL